MARTKQTKRKSTGGHAPRPCCEDPGKTTLHEIWCIAEIAENVLAHLPMKDLLLVQRVNKRWQALIKSSPTLQELLFFRPRRIKPAEDVESCGIQKRDLNPLLVEKFPLWFPEIPDEWEQTAKDVPWGGASARLAFMRRDASWRHMLPVQPALTTFELVHGVRSRGGDSLAAGSIELPDGVRMGLVYDKSTGKESGLLYGFPAVHTLICGKSGQDSMRFATGRYGTPTQVRLFGGVDKFTLFIGTTRGCGGSGIHEGHYEERTNCLRHVSVGFEEIDIELSPIESPPGAGHGWWNKDGYCMGPRRRGSN